VRCETLTVRGQKEKRSNLSYPVRDLGVKSINRDKSWTKFPACISTYIQYSITNYAIV
jgi:hypothetical protein